MHSQEIMSLFKWVERNVIHIHTRAYCDTTCLMHAAASLSVKKNKKRFHSLYKIRNVTCVQQCKYPHHVRVTVIWLRVAACRLEHATNPELSSITGYSCSVVKSRSASHCQSLSDVWRRQGYSRASDLRLDHAEVFPKLSPQTFFFFFPLRLFLIRWLEVSYVITAHRPKSFMW